MSAVHFHFFPFPFLLICSICVFVTLFTPWEKNVSISDDVLSLCDVSYGKRRQNEIFWNEERMYGPSTFCPPRLKGQFSTLTNPGFKSLSTPLPTLDVSSVHGEAGVGPLSPRSQPVLHLKSVFFTGGRFPPAQHPDARYKGTPESLNPFLYDIISFFFSS
ncbi:unnamed protein product [Lota lota]